MPAGSPPKCNCGLPAARRQVKRTDSPNKGRWFYGCSLFGTGNQCKFFAWANAEHTENNATSTSPIISQIPFIFERASGSSQASRTPAQTPSKSLANSPPTSPTRSWLNSTNSNLTTPTRQRTNAWNSATTTPLRQPPNYPNSAMTTPTRPPAYSILSPSPEFRLGLDLEESILTSPQSTPSRSPSFKRTRYDDPLEATAFPSATKYSDLLEEYGTLDVFTAMSQRIEDQEYAEGLIKVEIDQLRTENERIRLQLSTSENQISRLLEENEGLSFRLRSVLRDNEDIRARLQSTTGQLARLKREYPDDD